MSKIRIYELARELGVDNRIVLERAIELGMPGKKSHSSSLDSAEADQIRRALIRQAMGAKGSSAEPSKNEVVTKRIDTATGGADTIVERRRGNVIMRRRQATEPEPTPVVEETPVEESVIHSDEHSISIADADQLFVSQESPQEFPSVEVPTPEELLVTAESEPAEILVAESAETVEAPGVAPVAEAKRPPGPRVLGRIELPGKKVKIETKSGTLAVPTAAPVEIDEDEDSPKKKALKSRGKRRELTRTDLVDYEGGDSRRNTRSTGKTARSKESMEKNAAQEIKGPKQSKRVVKIDEFITVGELAKQMSLKAGEVLTKLISLGVMATINQAIDLDTASIIAEEFGFTIESTSFDETGARNEEVIEDPATLVTRPPVVTVMGHVDHGKTSLLDNIRKASVAAREHGGITQHIGAYQVLLESGKRITFIDTPGHAAFTSMRARGAQVTDLVILVVAADDGVMPQTVEAINHAKAAGVPILVAVNKMDRPNANVEKIKQQLLEHGLQPEEWGGDTMYFPVSALQGTGITELLEGVLLVSDVKELKANPDKRAKGTIIESRQDRGRGTVATVLVQSGTLKVGDIFVVGPEFGRVRSMVSDSGEKVTEASPSTPVEITGLNGAPSAGDDFFVVESDAQARDIAANRAEKIAKEERALASGPMSLEEFSRRANNLAAAELFVILKADVHGSLEAVKDSIENLSTAKVKVKVLHAAVGGVNESDIQLAIASQAIVIGFNVRGEPRAMQDAEVAGIETRFYRIIYEAIDDVKLAMVGLLAPTKEEVFLGRAEVRDTFSIPRIGTIAGTFVIDGTIKRGSFARVLRDSRVVYEGKMSSLRRFKDDVKEVQHGYECGIGIENFNDIKVGDVLEVFEQKDVAATID